MLAALLALSQSASKADLIECANYVEKAEQAACVANFEERKKLQPSSPLSPLLSITRPIT